MYKVHAERWQDQHADAVGNRLLQFARTSGRPLTKLSDAVTKVVRRTDGRLVTIHTCNPAIFDTRLRSLAELFPKVFTPILKDPEELYRRGLPSEVLFGPFIGWTAPGAPGFYDMWKKPAEFESTLYANPDIVTDGRLTEKTTFPTILGKILPSEP